MYSRQSGAKDGKGGTRKSSLTGGEVDCCFLRWPGDKEAGVQGCISRLVSSVRKDRGKANECLLRRPVQQQQSYMFSLAADK